FYVTTADHRGPSMSLGVCSSGQGGRSHTGTLRYTFVVPPGVSVLRCRAYAACPKGLKTDDRLDVFVLTEQSDLLPKQAAGAAGWEPAEGRRPRADGPAPEYRWELGPLVGSRVQIVLADEDPRRGCYLFCSGFRLTGEVESQEREFAEQMRRLVRD